VLNLRDEHINGLQQAAHVLNQPGSGSKRSSLGISGEIEEQPGVLLVSAGTICLLPAA
jgi:hypothetical protein